MLNNKFVLLSLFKIHLAYLVNNFIMLNMLVNYIVLSLNYNISCMMHICECTLHMCV